MTREDVNKRLKALGLPQWRLAEAIPMSRTNLVAWMQCGEIRKDRAEQIERGLQKLEADAAEH